MALACLRSSPENGRSKLESRIHFLRNVPKGMDHRCSPHMLLQDSSSTTSTFISDGDVLGSPKSNLDTSTDYTPSSTMITTTACRSTTVSGSLRLMPGSCTDRTHASAYQFYSARRGLFPESLSLRDRLNALRMNDFLCDLTVLCRDRVFPAHQAILMATSNVCTSLIEAASSRKQEVRGNQAEVTKLNLNGSHVPTESSAYQLLPRLCQSNDSDITSDPSTQADTTRTCHEPMVSLDDRGLPVSCNTGATNMDPKTCRIRGGGESFNEQEAVHECAPLCQTDSIPFPACDVPAGGQEDSTESKDPDYFPLLKQESNVYLMCSKKELEVTVENQRIRVKTVTSRVSCSKTASFTSFTSKPSLSNIDSKQLQDLEKSNQGCSGVGYPYFQCQSSSQQVIDFTPSPSGTEDSGVCLPEYPASEPNSSRQTSGISYLPDLESLLNAEYESTSIDDSDTNYDLKFAKHGQSLRSETTMNDDTVVPLRKCDSGTSLSNPTTWECGTDSEAFSGTISGYKRLVPPSLDSSKSKMKSAPTTQPHANASGANAAKCLVTGICNPDVSITIDLVDPDIFEVLLDFAYTGTYKKLRNLAVERFPEVNSAARVLEMNGINVLCSQAFREALTPKNFAALWNLADRAQSKPLMDAVIDYSVQHLDSLWMSPHLLQLPYERMLRLLLAAGNTSEMKPDLVLRTYLAWVKIDPACRCHTIKALWPVVHKSNITEAYARQLLTSDEFVKNATELRMELESIVTMAATCSSTHVTTSQSPSVDSSNNCRRNRAINNASLRLRSRTRSDNELYVSKRVGVREVVVNLKRDGANVTRKFRLPRPSAPPACAAPIKEKLGPPQLLKMVPTVDRRLTPKVPSVCEPAAIHEVVSLSSRCLLEARPVQPPLIVIGKSEPLGEVTVLKLEKQDGLWSEELVELNVVMEDKQAVHFHDVYVMLVGGEKGYMGRKLRTVFLCDLRTNWMIQLPDMHMGRSGAAIFMVGATMFVAGGKGRYGEDVSEVEALEVNERVLRWKVVPSMKVKRSSHSIVTTESGCAYAMGGGTNRCERFHPKLKKWTDVPSLPPEFARFDPVQVAVKNDVVAMIRHRPNELFVLSEERLAWSHCHVNGASPSTIVSATSWDRTIVIVDDKKVVFSCVLGEYEWKGITRIFRSHFKPVMIASQTGCDKKKLPPEIKWLRPAHE